MERMFTLLVAALLLVGCGQAEDPSGAPTTAPTPPTSISQPVDTSLPEPAPTTSMPELAAIALQPAVPAVVEEPTRSITVGGMGAEYAEPVRCIIDIGSTSRRPTVAAASAAAAASAKAMADALTAAGVASSNIQTSEFSVGTYYDQYPTIGGYETHIGYRVTLPDVDLVGSILADAVAAGGDDVRAWGVRFEADPTDLIGPAREKAWADVESRAAALAALAGEPLGDVLDVHEKVLTTTSQGMYQGGEGDSASFDIPVSPGVTGVVVLLTVSFAIGNA